MKNYSIAIERYGEAADSGDAAAQRKLGKVLLAEGLRYMMESIQAGELDAVEELEELLEGGQDTLFAIRHSQSTDGQTTDTSDMQVGATVCMGHVPGRDNPIEWQVLDIQENKALMLSKYVLEYRPFHERWGIVTWENSSIRKYLNTEFLEDAFSEQDRHRIEKSKVKADENPMCNTDPGNDTKDKIFLLSVLEAQKYMPVNQGRRCTYVFGDKTRNARCSWWWLRSPGFNEANAASAGDDGSFQYSYVRDVRGGIRPAIWLKL